MYSNFVGRLWIPLKPSGRQIVRWVSGWKCDRDSSPWTPYLLLCCERCALCTDCFCQHVVHVSGLFALRDRDSLWNWIPYLLLCCARCALCPDCFSPHIAHRVSGLFLFVTSHYFAHVSGLFSLCDRRSLWILYFPLCCARCALCPDCFSGHIVHLVSGQFSLWPWLCTTSFCHHIVHVSGLFTVTETLYQLFLSHHFAHVIRLLALHARDGPWNWIYTSFAVQGEHSVPTAFFTTLLIMSVVCLYCPWILHCVRHSPWILHCERHSPWILHCVRHSPWILHCEWHIPWILYLLLCCGRCAVCPDVVVVLSRSCSSVYPVHCV